MVGLPGIEEGGGAVYSGGWGDMAIHESLVTDNTSGQGSAVYIHISNRNAIRDKFVKIGHCIVLNNNTISNGAHLRGFGTIKIGHPNIPYTLSVNVENSIIRDGGIDEINTNDNVGTNVILPTVTHCNIQGFPTSTPGVTAVGCVDTDPGFATLADACDGLPGNPPAVTPLTGDRDADGIQDNVDNCPDYPNGDQVDWDSDGAGDACDVCPTDAHDDRDGDCICANPADFQGVLGFDMDDDGDFVANFDDNCRDVANPSQLDTDGDWMGDVCDPDDDNDGYSDTLEIALGTNPVVPNYLAGDINLDGTVNASDFARFISAFGSSRGEARYVKLSDINGDSVINATDFAMFIGNFGHILQ